MEIEILLMLRHKFEMQVLWLGLKSVRVEVLFSNPRIHHLHKGFL